jgi:tripartite-type tricarboxylate transporter receptor subunit TctC
MLHHGTAQRWGRVIALAGLSGDTWQGRREVFKNHQEEREGGTFMSRFSVRYPLSAIVACVIAAAPGIARAEYPEKEITVVVGTGAGGAADAGARMIAREMEKILGKPVVVVNKVGGGGTKALTLLTKEDPDGYSLVYAFSHHITFGGQYKRKKPLFKATDFDYIGSISEPRQSLVSLTGRGWTTFKGMLEKLNADGKPVRLVYAGGPGRLVATALQRDLKVPVKVIRVRGGGNAMQQLLGGHVDVAFSGGAHTKYTEAGQTVVLASVHEKRNPDFPDAPTLKEVGANASTTTLQVLVGPKGMPKAVKDKLADAVAKISANPEIVKLFHKNLSMQMLNLKGQELVDYMVAEEARFTKLIADFDDNEQEK